MQTGRTIAMLIGILLAVSMPSFTEAQEAKPSVKKKATGVEREPKVSIERAIQAAVERVPGRVHELDVVQKGGKHVWEVEVITKEGQHMLVVVDGITGAVIHTEEKTLQKLAGDPVKGKGVFESHCVSCHGPEGRGEGAMGPHLIPPAADFTSDFVRAKSDAELLHTIQEGEQGTAMRSFKHWLSKQEMRDVLAYVRQLSRGSEK